MNPKYWRTQLDLDGRTVCPWCGRVNHHKTGQCCEHVAKVTVKGVVFYYWGIRPVPSPLSQ